MFLTVLDLMTSKLRKIKQKLKLQMSEVINY